MSTGLRFTLEVDGLPPDAFAVVSFHLTQSLSSLFSLDLSLVSQQFLSLEFAQVLDKMAYLTVWQGDDVQRRVKGVVTWFELGENDKNQMLYSMKVCPPLWRTGLRQNFRIFQNEDIESILATILKENGVTEWSPLFSEPHPSREFCVQYGETDYDFLCRMAAEEGIFFYEEHAQKSTDQSLVLCDTVRYLPESFEIPWNPNTRTEVSTLCISQFRYSAQIRPSSVVTKDYTFKRPGWAGRFDQEGQYQDYQRTQYEVYDYPGRFKGAHGQNFARWQMDGWRNNAEVARGTSRSPEIWPGRRIALTGHPQANLNREWQVVASELHGEQPQAVPGRSGSGTTLNNHFAVIPADRTWRPQPLLKPLVDGPQSAVVTGPAGEEIFCDEHGRVRVKFNWDRYNPSNQDSSCWIRVAQAWAGTGFGNLAIPRVGQEVIVDFLNGDPDQPIIMGRTYHQENRTPGSLPGTKTQMTIRSKTYKGSGFNELKFDDATGKEQVYIHAQKNMNTEVLNNRTTDVINNHAETIGNNQMIAVTNNQIQTVGVNQIETVGSNQIIKVGSVQVETIGLVRALTVGVAYQTTVGGIMNTSVALMQSSQIGLHKSLRVGLGYDVKVGNNVTFTVGKTKKDDTGQTAIYSAGEHLELCCGKARLVLTKDGQIFLNGTKIHLQGKEQVNGDSLLINWNCAASKSPPTGELLWQHETKHAYNEQGLANHVTPDSLPPVEWLTYGSGYLAGMKLGGTPLVEYTRDRLHRETVRSFGSMAGSNAAYELTSTYTPAGQLQSQHLNSLVYDRDYGWSDNGDLVRISGPRQTREYGYSATGRLESVRTLAPDLDIRIPYATDPAGNRLPDPELHPDSTLTAWPDNRIAEDAHYVYHYDEYGRLTEKTDLIPAGVIRTDDERTHHYHYDSQHRLVFYTRIQHGEPLVESRYLYDPLGRRMAKRVWRRERDLTGWMSLSRKPEMTWYGWDGDRLTTVQTDTTRIQTVYQPGSFAPLIRIETDNGEREKAQRRSLAEKLQQEGSEDGHGVVFPAELVRLLDRLEEEIRADRVSSESRVWLAQCGLTVEQLARQVEPEYTPARKVHFYHCDHRGLPLALISEDGNTVWSAEYDEWGNQLNEENPYYLYQPYRLPGQQYDEESGLDYNRHRYYDPLQGRYITQDPIGLAGGWSLYAYPLNPVQHVDPLGLSTMIIGNGPVPDNPFGHAAAANRYGLMSSGTGDEMGASVSDYFKKMQPRRDTWIWIIDTTDEEEQCMMNKAIDLNKKLKTINLGPLPVANNCFSRTNMIFEACGFSNPSMNTNAPISLQVLGELYGYQRYFMPKGPFTGFPFEFQEVK
ncbi:type VI secretion system tip protein VgrG [Escherichia coli]|nr:type VI secretion system tip protein TssI/VgrG [Escherichia coli]MQI07264.1 type VI secretion system tip protein VgrG [Escherichia coli]MQK73876.1 type VI secretion system tip protein VgrG [Escherichia coli]